MSRKNLLATATSVAVLAMTGAAFGQCDITFQPTSGDWGNANNWSPARLPTSSDRVCIPSGKDATLQDDDAAVDGEAKSLDLDGSLNIAGGAVLEVGDSGTSDLTSNIDGPITLQGSGSVIYFKTNNHTLADSSSNGEIVGQNASAEIKIEPGKTLTSGLDGSTKGIRGMMKIVRAAAGSNATFHNAGVVHANDAGTLLFDVNVSLDDDANAEWNVSTSSSAVLRFETDATTLSGPFSLDGNGVIFVRNVDVSTAGDFTCTSGTVDVAPGSFEFLRGGAGETKYTSDHTCP